MSETFRASNGWHIDEDGHFASKKGIILIGDADVDKARQFFIEERDAELGRWRDKERPEFVCYDMGTDMGERIVRVVHEYNGVAEVYSEVDVHPDDPSFQGAAGRYFQAHPIHKPLPEALGLYANAADVREFPHDTCVLTHDNEGWHIYGNPENNAERSAQAWHDAGQLVRLAPVESEGE